LYLPGAEVESVQQLAFSILIVATQSVFRKPLRSPTTEALSW